MMLPKLVLFDVCYGLEKMKTIPEGTYIFWFWDEGEDGCRRDEGEDGCRRA